MREFNTSGPCDPTLHYTVMREKMLAIGRQKVAKGRYFTLFAPRQSGKTTYFHLLLEELKHDGFTPIWISFENLKTLAPKRFYEALNYKLQGELAEHQLEIVPPIGDPFDLELFFHRHQLKSASIVLIIDEFEGIPDEVLSEVMHTFRQIYHQKKKYALHSLILVGVSTIADLVLSSASPFNIAEEFQLPYFTFEEVYELIQQYIKETGQPFTEEVIKAIYHNTHGQPGLVCALCLHLVTEMATDRSQPVSMSHFYPTLKYFITQKRDKNITNIVQKAREKPLFMLKLLFQTEPIPFSIYDHDMSWLAANGVVDVLAGAVDVLVPLYKKVLVTVFSPIINGETRYYITSIHDTVTQYLTAEGGLDVNALLEAYRAYVRRRGGQAFDTEHLREGAWHYSLDGFLYFFIEQLGGQTFVEVPSGRGRIDILIRYQAQSYLIETKRFVNNTYFKQGKGQLAAYLQSEGLAEGYYVVFSDIHTDQDTLYNEEMIDGKRIYTHIILTHFEPPSRLPVPEALKNRS